MPGHPRAHKPQAITQARRKLLDDPVGFYEAEAAATDRYGNASFWDARYHNRRRAVIASILRQALRPGDRFLDAGCGSGEYLELAEERGARSIGVDLAGGYLLRIKASSSSFDLARAELGRLPLRDAGVDVSLCSEVLEHLLVPRTAAEELFRVTSRAVLVTTPNQGLLRRTLRRVAPGRLDALDLSVGHISVMSLSQLQVVLRMPGWRIESVRTLHILPPVIMESLRLPSFFDGLVGLIERLLQRVAPLQGNDSLVLMLRDDG